MGAKPTHLEKLNRVQATMERIGGFKAQPLAGRREAALVALSFKQLDGECREGLREYAPLLHTVKLADGKLNSRHNGLLRQDYSEKSQGRWTSVWRIRKFCRSQGGRDVDVTATSGLQVKSPSKKPKSVGSLEVFSDSAAGALPAIWAKLHQSLVLEGEKK